jgi:acyl carrier protein
LSTTEVNEAGMITLPVAIEAVRSVVPAKRRDRVQLAAETRFEEDLGFSSLDVGEVFVRLEELVGTALDTSRIEHTKTIGDLLVVERADEDRAW